jgi:hypothetical protein
LVRQPEPAWQLASARRQLARRERVRHQGLARRRQPEAQSRHQLVRRLVPVRRRQLVRQLQSQQARQPGQDQHPPQQARSPPQRVMHRAMAWALVSHHRLLRAKARRLARVTLRRLAWLRSIRLAQRLAMDLQLAMRRHSRLAQARQPAWRHPGQLAHHMRRAWPFPLGLAWLLATGNPSLARQVYPMA